MPDTKITALAAIVTVDPAVDVLPIVDVSDTSMAASGTTKKITSNQLLGAGGTATLASATITGDLTAARLIVTGGTIPTNGLWLPTTNTLEFAANSLAQYRIAPLGVFSWYDGAGGTRMTLNSTGLGVGGTPITKFFVQDATLTGTGQIREQVIQAKADNVNNSLNSLVGITFLTNPLAYTAGSFSKTSGVYGINLDNAAFGRRMGLVFYTSEQDATALERVRIDNSGNLLVGVTSANANGGVLQLKSGITFPATQVASSDANTLDDYEEGTWTATLNSGTFTSQVFKYTKIGNMVTVFFDFIVATGGGDRVTNLPFTAGGTVANGIYTNAQTYAAGTTAPTAVVGGSGTVMYFRTVGTGVAFSAMTLTAGAAITGSISYFV